MACLSGGPVQSLRRYKPDQVRRISAPQVLTDVPAVPQPLAGDLPGTGLDLVVRGSMVNPAAGWPRAQRRQSSTAVMHPSPSRTESASFAGVVGVRHQLLPSSGFNGTDRSHENETPANVRGCLRSWFPVHRDFPQAVRAATPGHRTRGSSCLRQNGRSDCAWDRSQRRSLRQCYDRRSRMVDAGEYRRGRLLRAWKWTWPASESGLGPTPPGAFGFLRAVSFGLRRSGSRPCW